MRIASILLTCCLVLAATGVSAETTFLATMDAQQDVPPLSGITATGNIVLVLNDAQTELSFTIDYQGLSSPEVGAHIHNAGPRDNGPIVFALPLGTPKVGVWQIPANYVTELLAGRLYVNIHTQNYISGEIRGNIGAPVPVENHTWGAIKALYR